MAIYHCSVKNISRSGGKSAVASASYRAGEKLEDRETGLTHDYTNKSEVAYSEIFLCENAPREYQDRETLWNAVEEVEKQNNARLAREWEVALPNELTLEQGKELVRGYAQSLRKQYDRDSKRVEELRSELRELRIERENTAKKLQEAREELFSLNADKIHAEYEKRLTRAMRRILDSHACMIESRKPLFGGKGGEVLVDAEQLGELQDTARFWEGLQEQNRTLQEKLIKENNRRHDLETKLSVQADDIKRKRELIEELGELIMAEKGVTTNDEYVEWYLKSRKVSQN